MAVEVTRILERCQKESRAVDTESLCIIAGVKVSSDALFLPPFFPSLLTLGIPFLAC